MSRKQMVELFTLDRVRSAPSQLDMTKLLWMNGEHLKKKSPEAIAAGCKAAMQQQGLWNDDIDPAYFAAVVACMGERVRLYSDLGDQAAFFFNEEFPYDEKSVRKRLLKEGALDIVGEEQGNGDGVRLCRLDGRLAGGEGEEGEDEKSEQEILVHLGLAFGCFIYFSGS